MEFSEAMSSLESAGTAQNRKIYARHGVRGAMFGVSYAALGKLARRIKKDHPLAKALWASGNHDARVLATQVADPAAATSALLEAWRKDLDNYVLTDAFVKYVSQTSLADQKIAQWTSKKAEWTAGAGWSLLAYRARSLDWSQKDLAAFLPIIEAEIHQAKNRVRHSMISALIAIGIRGGQLQKKAVAAAKRIGPVEVDHGETGCKTPDPIPYIAKAMARRIDGYGPVAP